MKRIVSILLCCVMLAGLLVGCRASGDPEAYIPTGEELEPQKQPEVTEEAAPQAQEFSLAYYADQSMNPLNSADYTNRVVLSLIYQGLFSVSRENEIIPVLCKSYSASTDLTTYEFTIDPAASFSDGVPVRPEDVVASLEEARNHRFYSGRLRFVQNISVTEDRKVQIRLSQPNGNLPLLLDIPIVKALQVEADHPLGSGPYKLSGVGTNLYLARCEGWWCESDDLLITAKKIPLTAAESTTEIRDAFEFFDVGIVCTDPGSDRYAEYRCDYELWDCETGIFLYLAVNADSSVFQSQQARQAISRGIDRSLLIDRYYRGFAVSAELPASPNSPYYTAPLAKQYAYDPGAYQDMMGSMKGRNIKLLVNSSDSLRVRVAQEIGRMLNTSGLIVEVVPKSDYAYEAALIEGDYDLYLGQTKLSPNMDLTSFFSENGALSYGDMDDIGVYTLCLQALENQGNYYSLHQRVMEDGYLCPILFRSYAVYASRGLLTDLQPARDNLFCYSIGRTQTDAYIIGGV